MSVVASRLSAFFVEAETVSRFIRFGEPPTSGRSKVWQAPTVFHTSQQGTDLLGMSVYEARRRGRKWQIMTDGLQSYGMTSLSDLLFDALNSGRKIYLLKGRFLRWGHIPPDERRKIDKDMQGYARDPIIGTDGEYLVRDYQILGQLNPLDIVVPALNFPANYTN